VKSKGNLIIFLLEGTERTGGLVVVGGYRFCEFWFIVGWFYWGLVKIEETLLRPLENASFCFSIEDKFKVNLQ
jgi:hypothetical protein